MVYDMIKDFEIWHVYRSDNTKNIFSWFNKEGVEYRLGITPPLNYFNIWVDQRTPDIKNDFNSIKFFTI